MTEGTSRPTILVIADGDETRTLIRRLSDEAGYRVLEAADGVAGLTLAYTERLDCVILDLGGLQTDGLAVLERLQRDPRSREIPVIVLGPADERLEAMERAIDGGAFDYLPKPLSPRHMAIRVRGAIERRRSLQEVQELRASFTSMLVHDLRAPLTTLLAYVDVLEETVSGGVGIGPAARYLAQMREAGVQMQRLTEEILKLSKLEAGQLVVDRRPMDLATLAAAVVDRFEPAARSGGVVLQLRGSDRPLPVLGDAVRLDQVLTNLLGNALKFTPRSGRIVVTLAERDGDAEVAVADSGPGIRTEEMALLFEKFRQASLGRSSRHAGAGLGLVICRHLVEAHGGSIHAESPPGAGARFVFRLPLRQEGAAAARSRPRSVLIVDDDHLARNTLVEMLATDGHTVDTAPAAGVALQMIDERTYDVILCDIQMPGVDGLEFYAELERTHPDLCRRLIFITGYGLGARMVSFLEQTATRYLRKPIPLDRLRGVLDEAG